ncbi:hypothetical protein ACFFRR_010092 [Megaselia abdita]
MTVTYTAEVSTCRGFGCFLKLLLRWRGSIYKLVWLDLITFLVIYYILNISYRFWLDTHQKQTFENIVRYCEAYSNLIPLSFVLGFYVSIVMTRWWNQYTSIPWPDSIAVFVSANVHGQDERGRVMRRTVMRYVCLCLTMVLINISPRVKKRFPKLNNLVEAGLLVENEKLIMESLNEKFPRHSKHWLPIVWASSIITRARKEGRIRDDFAVKTIIDELNKFRGQCGLLISYDTISVPLVYTQVVTLAVYSYFLTSVMGTQWVETKGKNNSGNFVNTVDLYFPFFTTLQFFFYMGWLKVAESLINPFGEDDDDFEVNWMVDRNLQVSYMIVDEMHHEHPELIKDQYWDEVFPSELPYSVAAERFREEHPEPSTAKIEVSKMAAMPSTLSSVKIDEMMQDDNASGIHFTAGNGKMRHLSQGSSPSLQSVSGLTRVSTVASALKRFLSRDSNNPETPTLESTPSAARLAGSASSASLGPQYVPGKEKLPGSIKIADQVIEEVDEQLTITSQRGDIQRPNVMDIFPNDNSAPKHSAPLDVPMTKIPSYVRTQSAASGGEPCLFPPGGVDALLSTSAPSRTGSAFPGEMVNTPLGESVGSLYRQGGQDYGSRETVEDLDTPAVEDDDFERLRKAREKERQERTQIKLARSISTQPGIALDGEQTVEPTVPTVACVPATPVRSGGEEVPTSTEENRLSLSGAVTPSNSGTAL